MPVKPLNLDDRTFSDLVGEARLLIPRYARPWTDHNVSDPGIMLIELFAWLTEALLYRINRVPDPSRMRLLELLGASFRPAEPAVLELRVTWHGTGDRYELPIGARVRADGGSAKPVFFEVLHEVEFTSLQPVRTVTARQTVRIDSKELSQVSDGEPLQLFPLNDGFFTAPPRRRQRRPQVLVAGEPWEYRAYLRESQGTDTHFTFKPWLESIAFGDGHNGASPPAGALIEISYHSTPTKPGVVKEKFRSGGRPWQTYRLSQPLPLIDLEEPSDLEPKLQVEEPNSQVLSPPWEFVAGFLDMAKDAPQYVVEPWHNAIRFGNGINGTHGKVPTAGATIKIAYHQTLGAAGNIPPTSKFSFWSSPIADMDANEKSWTRVENLEAVAWEILSPGRDATTLDDARNQVYALLQPGWRAVTDGDFVSIVQRNQPEIARVVCLPGHDPAAPEPSLERPGHVGIIVIPRATSAVTAPEAELRHVRAIAANNFRLVAEDAAGVTWLWNMNDRRKITELAERPLRDLIFSPNGLRLLVVSPSGPTELWDTNHGRLVTVLEQPTIVDVDAGARGGPWEQAPASTTQVSLSHALFSPDGQHLAAIHTDGRAYLWESKDGVPVKDLGAVTPSILPLFSSDGRMLATARGDIAALLRRLDVDEQPFELQLGAPVTQMAFSSDGARLAIAAADANARLCRIRPENGQVLETLPLDLGQPVKALVFDPSGTRLAAHGNDGSAALWSSRTGARIASLSAQAPVDLVTFSGDGRWLATAHRDHTVRCWNARNGREVFPLSNTLPVHAMVFSPTGHRLVVVGALAQQTPILEAWDLRGVSAERVATQPLSGSQPVVLNESGQWLAYTDERLVHVWDVEKSKDITAFYVDFDDPGIQGDGWSLVTSHDDANSAPAAQVAPIRVTRGPYLWVVSAAGAGTAVKRAVQVLDAEHVYRVDALLGKRKLVTSQHHVEGPTYKDVGVSVRVTRRTLMKSQQSVTADISNALSRFFDPLHGGPEGTGWPLGRSVHASEVFEVVEGVAAVDHVEHLTLKIDGSEKKDRVDIPPQNLVNCHIQVE